MTEQVLNDMPTGVKSGKWTQTERLHTSLAAYSPDGVHLPDLTLSFSVLGVADFIGGVKVLLATVSGKQMQFAVRYKAEKLDQIVSFAKPMEGSDLISLNACMDGLMERMKVLAQKK